MSEKQISVKEVNEIIRSISSEYTDKVDKMSFCRGKGMIEQRFCPKCNSKDYEIEQRFIQEKRLNEYSFCCLNCGYKLTSLGNLQKINRECRRK